MKPILTILLCAAFALTATADTVKIGVILPLSGNNAASAEILRPALALFEKEVATGKNIHDYKIILEDDQQTPRLNAQAANKLINIDHVDGIITWTSAPGNVVGPVAAQKQIPHLAICGDPSVGANNSYSFNHWVSAPTSAKALVEVLKQLKSKNIVLLGLHHQGVNALVDALKPNLAEANITILDEQYFNPGERDFRMILTKIREQHPDAVVPLAFPPEIEIILRQAKQMGLNVPMPSEVYDFMTDLSPANGQYDISCSRGTPEFQEHLRSLTGEKTAYGVPFLYNTLDFFRAAYETTPTKDHTAVINYLSHLKDYPSAVGLVSVNSSCYIDASIAYCKVINGEIVPVTLDEIK